MAEKSDKPKVITDTKKENNFKRNSAFAFISGLISLVLSSWVFQFIIWGIFDLEKIWKIFYIIIVVIFPVSGVIVSIFSVKSKRGLIGLILNFLVLLSFIITTLIYFL
ncbi:MAG: hypothetical protein ACTSO7_06000 [Candidatus Heimdallarchaeota archaeon]